MEKPYTYQAYGLTVFSDMILPELKSTSCRRDVAPIPDAVFVNSSILSKDESTRLDSDDYQCHDDFYFLQIKGVARYTVYNGRTISIEIVRKKDLRDVRVYLLGTVFGLLLHQRQLLPLHASSVVLNNGESVLFTGVSGAGKSTIAAYLSERGYPLLSDDVTAIHFETGHNNNQVAMAWPGFPRIKLWSDAIRSLNKDPQKFTRDLLRSEKYHLPMDEAQFSSKAIPISHIVELVDTNNSEQDARLEMLSSLSALSVVMKNTYRVEALQTRQQQIDLFHKAVRLTQAVSVYKLERAKDFATIDIVLDLITRLDVRSRTRSIH